MTLTIHRADYPPYRVSGLPADLLIEICGELGAACSIRVRADWLDEQAAIKARAVARTTTVCACGHHWTQHTRQPNGAYGCTSFGCGCRDVVLPQAATVSAGGIYGQRVAVDRQTWKG